MKDVNQELADLLVQRATVGLSAAEEGELIKLLEREGFKDSDDIALAVAAAANAFAAAESKHGGSAAPARLQAKLLEDADRFFGQREQSTVVTSLAEAREKTRAARPSVRHHLGWAAAAVLAVALFLTTRLGVEPEMAPFDPVDARAQLIAAAPGTTVVPWAPSAFEEFATVSGDVAWNDDLQQGFMRLTGMPVNDPTNTQYQLWIVDSDRDVNPVDGGVFDIPPGGGEVVIPIDAKLRVAGPEAFAITREKPGGVVVSAGPLLVVAAAG